MNHLTEYTQLAQRAFDNQVFNSDRFGSAWLECLDAELSNDVARLRLLNRYGETIDRYVASYKNRVSAGFGAESRCASSAVCGPSNFPVERNRKRRQAAQNHWEELTAFRLRVMAKMERAARTDSQLKNGITPLIETQRNLNRRVKEQVIMRLTNAALRKAKTENERETVLLLLGCEPPQVLQLLKPYWNGKYGYESWRLSNNNAQIVRLKERVEHLKRMAVKAEAETTTGGPQTINFPGGHVELNYSDDRLRIVHDEKPGPAVIASLKRSGFKWSPSNVCWQRQLTGNARYAAEQLLTIKL